MGWRTERFAQDRTGNRGRTPAPHAAAFAEDAEHQFGLFGRGESDEPAIVGALFGGFVVELTRRTVSEYGLTTLMVTHSMRHALDLGGRAYLVFEGEFPRDEVGGMPTELVAHFFRSLSDTLRASLHIRVRGENTHHMIEACFKGVARALRQAIQRKGESLPSTKGSI